VDRRLLEVALLATLAVVALAAAAATLPTAVPGGGGGGGPGTGHVSRGVPVFGSRHTPAASKPVPLDVLRPVVLALLLVGLAALLVYTFRRRREAFWVLVAVLGLLALVAALQSLPTGSGAAGNGSAPWNVSFAGGAGGPPGAGHATPRAPAIALVLLAIVVVGAVLVVGHTASRALAEASAGDEAREAEAAALGRAAGRAADRLEATADLENAVYRAWREMTRLLEGAHGPATTPGEFAAAAVDAGLERADVQELTRLFEDVRYGGSAADEPTEDRAMRVLRRIEAAAAAADDRSPNEPGGNR